MNSVGCTNSPTVDESLTSMILTILKRTNLPESAMMIQDVEFLVSKSLKVCLDKYVNFV